MYYKTFARYKLTVMELMNYEKLLENLSVQGFRHASQGLIKKLWISEDLPG